MIPYSRQNITRKDIEAVTRVLRSDFLTQGPTVKGFEQSVSDFCGAKYAVGSNSATSALHVACLAMGLGTGDWLWTTPNTFVASANCALYCQAKIDFVDIDPHTYNISVEALSEKLSRAKPLGLLPKIVIVVHFAGQPCDMEEIFKLSKEYNFRIIEDASHAIGAVYNGKKVGSCQWSDVTIFSFHPVKIITSGEGGMCTTNNSSLAVEMTQLRSHGITSDNNLMEYYSSNEIWNYQQIKLGFNYRMTDICAALGVSQLTRIDQILKKRRKVAEIYDQGLRDLPLKLPWQSPLSRSSFHLYPICLEESGNQNIQKLFHNYMKSEGILVNLHYIPVYLHPFYQKMGFKRGYCPMSEIFYKTAVSIPIFEKLSRKEQYFIIEKIKCFFLQSRNT